MEIHIDGIRHDLQAAAAALGDEAVSDALRRLSDAVEPSLRLRIIDLLSEAALRLNGQLDEGHIEVRLAGREPELVFVDEPEAPDEPPAPGDDLSARITLRLPEGLKSGIEIAAVPCDHQIDMGEPRGFRLQLVERCRPVARPRCQMNILGLVLAPAGLA